MTQIKQILRYLIERLISGAQNENYIQQHLFGNFRYQNVLKLNRYEFQAFSQCGQDGIISEIFRRIGTTNRFFVEFGVGDGLENNTVNLLIKGWSGIWIDTSKRSIGSIRKKFNFIIKQQKLILKKAFITKENITSLFTELDVPSEFDLLSIDIDGNDYWVWDAITTYAPRVVVIEYNPQFEPSVQWVMKYNSRYAWNGSGYFGASLKSLELLGSKKGYHLVGCDFSGADAFFVRRDLSAGKFLEPFTSENHYEPLRLFLIRKTGFRRNFGEFEAV